jgi:hypothetical protein
MNYSPRLKKIAEEIKAIYEKYDIGGLTILHEPGYVEYLFKLDPSYTAITYLPDGIRIKGNDIKKLENSSNLLRMIADTGGPMIINLIDLSEEVDKALGAEHGKTVHTPHNSDMLNDDNSN